MAKLLEMSYQFSSLNTEKQIFTFSEHGHLCIYFSLRLYMKSILENEIVWLIRSSSFSSHFEFIQSFCKRKKRKNRKIFVNNSHVIIFFIKFQKEREFHTKLIFERFLFYEQFLTRFNAVL